MFVSKFISNFAPLNKTNLRMDKGIKIPRKLNPLVVEKLSVKFGLSKTYIRQCLNKTRNSETADTICKEYKKYEKEINNVLNDSL